MAEQETMPVTAALLRQIAAMPDVARVAALLFAADILDEEAKRKEGWKCNDCRGEERPT